MLRVNVSQNNISRARSMPVVATLRLRCREGAPYGAIVYAKVTSISVSPTHDVAVATFGDES